MKKTVSVNLGGIVFNINEDAYEELKRYLEAIEGFFDRTRGREEIMEDIESRIAELLNERPGNREKPVTVEEIKSVMDTMGRPEDFADDEGSDREEPSYSDYTRVRKRLYRDGDNSMVGGVCAGLGHYFGTDPTWIRILWVIALIGFGVGLLVYVVLWIIIPKAVTTAEKLEMRGKPVNFSTIGRSVEVEAEHLKNKFEDFSKSGSAEKFKSEAEKAGRSVWKAVVKGFQVLVKIVRKILGVVLVFAGIAGVISVVVGIFGSSLGFVMIGTDHDFISYSYNELSDLIFENDFQMWSALGGTLLLTASPLSALGFAGLALLLYPRRISAAPGWFIFGAFIIGIFGCVYAGLTAAGDFAKRAVVTEKHTPAGLGDTLYLEVEEQYEGEQHYKINRSDLTKGALFFADSRGEHFFIDQVNFDIQLSRDTAAQMVLTKKARGRSFEQADKRARNIQFDHRSEDGKLQFSKFIKLSREDKWRAQHIDVLLRLPRGTVVVTNDETKPYFAEISRSKTNTFIMERGGLKRVR